MADTKKPLSGAAKAAAEEKAQRVTSQASASPEAAQRVSGASGEAAQYDVQVAGAKQPTHLEGGGAPQTDAAPPEENFVLKGERVEVAPAVHEPLRSDVVPVQQPPAPRPASGDRAPTLDNQGTSRPASRSTVVGPFGLAHVARLEYGDPAYARDIFDANRDVLVDPDNIRVGTIVRLPDLDELAITRELRANKEWRD